MCTVCLTHATNRLTTQINLNTNNQWTTLEFWVDILWNKNLILLGFGLLCGWKKFLVDTFQGEDSTFLIDVTGSTEILFQYTIAESGHSTLFVFDMVLCLNMESSLLDYYGILMKNSPACYQLMKNSYAFYEFSC